MTPNKCAKTGVNMFHSYMVYTYSERGHSGLQDYVLFEKSNFLRKIDFRRGASPLNKGKNNLIFYFNVNLLR
jgi:hypothetical protein